MSLAARALDASRKTALLIMRAKGDMALCPFFGKCDGLVVFDPDDGSREFHANAEHSADSMCELILKSGVHRLVLGFVPGPVARKLHAAGVDVRLGSCSCAIEHLAEHFDVLPAASPESPRR